MRGGTCTLDLVPASSAQNLSEYILLSILAFSMFAWDALDQGTEYPYTGVLV